MVFHGGMVPRVMVAVPQIQDWDRPVGDGVLGLLGAPLFYAHDGHVRVARDPTYPASNSHQIAIK
jgi:hypothetical protein